MKKLASVLIISLCTLSLSTLISCDGSSSASSSGCTLTDNTTETATISTNGCYKVTRDTSSCLASRTAQGLSGFWLNFSCRVTLTVSGGNVTIVSDIQPDHTSNYFQSNDPCYSNNQPAGRYQNPNFIAEQSVSMTVPLVPTPSTSAMPLGIVGIAVNGVAIYSNAAAPGDNIYDEADSFDYCEGHPDGSSVYHYHIEPPTASNNDADFIGVMRDGYPVYGIQEHGGGSPTLDAQGGHTGTTPDSGSATYHYHTYQQTEGSAPFRNAYFITSGTYAGAIGTCTGC